MRLEAISSDGERHDDAGARERGLLAIPDTRLTHSGWPPDARCAVRCPGYAALTRVRCADPGYETGDNRMGCLITKYLLTARVDVLASEPAQRSDKLGAV